MVAWFKLDPYPNAMGVTGGNRDPWIETWTEKRALTNLDQPESHRTCTQLPKADLLTFWFSQIGPCFCRGKRLIFYFQLLWASECLLGSMSKGYARCPHVKPGKMKVSSCTDGKSSSVQIVRIYGFIGVPKLFAFCVLLRLYFARPDQQTSFHMDGQGPGVSLVSGVLWSF